MKDIVLQALRKRRDRAEAPVPQDDMISIIREVLREEISASSAGQDEGLLIRTLAAHGVIPAAAASVDWDDLLTDDNQTFVFRTQ
ncbi:hypothetical protein [Pseudooceanicola nanhaiensis]|uniref:hypothetical protein n=1 Tax=Pseudooceanicola nanhaiensis TaxID=375761 RepID=UPI001CD28540|nr:hypothetical protein [Pseudooceanicola nanhaiensis]MCA0919644.1 hypothetical protein [Pseudooceanicola nanhaiensis]